LSLSVDPGYITLTGQDVTVTPPAQPTPFRPFDWQNPVVKKTGLSAHAVTVGSYREERLTTPYDWQNPVRKRYVPQQLQPYWHQINVGSNLSLSVDPGAITLTGQTINTSLSTTPAKNFDFPNPVRKRYVQQVHNPYWYQITAGTDLSLAIDTAGQITLAGQPVTIQVADNLTLDIDTAGQITLAGQSISFAQSMTFTEGGMTLAGQSVNVALGVGIVYPGYVYIAGQSITVLVSGAPLWPDPADVRAGVVYGPTGTEYVGTMTGGGGNYMRRR
jgi:hypothetical protein